MTAATETCRESGRRLRVGVETSIAVFEAAGSGRYSRRIVEALRREAPPDIEIVEIAPSASAAVRARGWRRSLFVLFWELVYAPLLLPRRVRESGIDLLHCTAPVPFRGRLPVPVIATIHDTIVFSHPEWFNPWRRWRTRRWWRLAARADFVLASSHATRRNLACDLGVPEERSGVVWLGTDIVPPETPASDGGFLLCVGTIEPRKNLSTVLEAVARLKARSGGTPPLWIAGAAGWGDVNLESALERLGLREDVRLLGFVSEERLAQLYASALALLYLSLDEGFGFPPLEAMACGCPVVASRVASIPEVVGDAGVLVDPRDPEAISLAIEELLADPSRAQALRERGRLRARTFTWTECARRTLDVYRRVAGRPPAAS